MNKNFSSSFRKRGFAILPIILIIAGVLIAAGGGTYLYKKLNIKNKKEIPEQQVAASTQSAADETANSSVALTTGWKTYRNSQYGFQFDYPSDFKISEPPVNPILRISSPTDSYLGGVVTGETDYYKPGLAGVKSWVISHSNNFIDYGNGDFENKVGASYSIAGLETLHLLQHTSQGGVLDEFYFIRNGRLFLIQVEPEQTPTLSAQMQKNLDLADDSKWYNRFLHTFKFIK